MKNHIIVNNERGGMVALLSVFVLSVIMVSTLSSFYIYLENRARFQERIRINHQVGYVMEDLGRTIAQASEQVISGACPVANIRWLDCSQVCTVDTAALPGTVPSGTPARAVCVKNDNLNKIVNNADYFCAYNTIAGGTSRPSYCAAIAKNDYEYVADDGATVVASHQNLNQNKITKWYSRLDSFFDTTIVRVVPKIANKMYPVLESKIQPPTMFGWLVPAVAIAVEPPQEPPPTPPTGGNYPPGYIPPDGGGGTVIGGGTPIHVNPDCETNPEAEGCAAACEADATQAFCKNVESKINIARIDNGCSATSTDARCKRCIGSDRNAGACLKISICPPWIPADQCMGNPAGGAVDRRIHQMVRVGDWVAAAPPPGPAPTGPTGNLCTNFVCNPIGTFCHWLDCP